jgi:hypothetical protein
VLLKSASRLQSAHRLHAISAIMEDDELYLLDENEQRHDAGDFCYNHQTFARVQACRRRLHFLIVACNEGAAFVEEVNVEADKLTDQLTELASETEETLAKFPELTGHVFRGVLPNTLLGPYDDANCWIEACWIEAEILEDCLKRTQLHRLLDQATEGSIFWGKFNIDLDYMIEGGDIDHTDYLGRSMLHLACQNGWEDGVKTLLNNGADPSAETIYGSLSLHYAAAKGFLGICILLLEHKDRFDVDGEDWTEWTALDYAANKGHDSVARLLESASSASESVSGTPKQTDADQHPATVCLWSGCEAGGLGSTAQLKAHVLSKHLSDPM